MGKEQKRRSQLFAANIGTRELLRFICAFIIWFAVGIGLGLVSGNVGYLIISQSILWCFAWFSPIWQPMYKVLYWILGNHNLPTQAPIWKPSPSGWIAIGVLLAFHALLLYEGFKLLFFK
jgi:hypothetical protein